MSLSFENVCAKLGAKQVGSEWLALCPAHDDHNPSLAITRGNKQPVVFTCRAGCTQEAVWKGVYARVGKDTAISHEDKPPAQPIPLRPVPGWSTAITQSQESEVRLKLAEGHLNEAESFLASRGIDIHTARRKRFGFEAPYLVIPTFVDGEIVSVKLRNTNPSAGRDDKWKKFRRHEKTYWLFNRESLANSNWEDCFIVESELDATMLESHGHRAVSVDSAGHKLEPADAALLKDYSGRLLFAPDTDKPGISCGLRIAEEARLESTIGIKLPTKDLGDLFALDPAAFPEKLAGLRANPIPLWQFGFRAVCQLEQGEVRMLIKGISPEGNNMIGAASGVGKTWVQLSQAKAICTGEKFMGTFDVPERMKVIYLIPEAGDRGFRMRCEKMHIPMDGSVFLCRTMRDGILRLNDPLLMAAVKDWRPVIFLDTAIRFAEFTDENSSAENAGGLATLIFQLLTTGATAVFSAHHSPKRTAEPHEKTNKLKGMTLENMLAGTRDIGAMCDSVWGLQPDDGGKGSAKDYLDESHDLTRLYVKCLKPRDFEPADPFRIQGKPHIDEKGDFIILAADCEPGEDVYERAAELISEDNNIGVRTLANKLGISRAHFKKDSIPGWEWKETSRTSGLWISKTF
jgi:hypothetical protein